MYRIKEAARLSGVSVKTLHHYDKIGLLVPHKSEAGYRLYSEADLERLQVILYYKYLGFSLGKIAELLGQDWQGLLPHLTNQLNYLQQERERLDTLISTLQQTIQAQKGEIEMTTEEKFAGFSYADHEKYREQAIERYGQEVVDEADARQTGQEDQATQAFNQVFQTLAAHLQEGLPVTAEVSQQQAGRLFELINRFGFDCSLEIFGQIAQGYVHNPEFKENIDRFGLGTAQYTADVVAAYVQNKQA